MSASHRHQTACNAGFILLPAMLMLSVVAVVAYLLSVEGAMSTSGAEREIDSLQARLVAEAGVNHARWQLQQNSTCTGYTDLPDTSFGAHAFTVAVSPDAGSPVTLTAIGTTATGGFYNLNRTVRVYQPPIALTLIPDAAAGKDTNLRSGANRDNNYGAARTLWVSNVGANDVALFEFDLSTIPATASVTSAQLDLDYGGATAISNGVFDVHRVKRKWWEGTDDGTPPLDDGANYDYRKTAAGKAWDNPGGDYANTPEASITINTLVEMRAVWEIGELVQKWVDGSKKNKGLLVRASGGLVDNADFTSSDHPGAGGHPKLTVTYRCPCDEVCAAATQPNLAVSSRLQTKVGGFNAKDGHVVELDTNTMTGTSLFADNKIAPANTNAVHRLSDGRLVLSANVNATVTDYNFAPGDLVVYDPVADSTSMYLNGLIFDDAADINAIHMLGNGHVLLSTREAETLAGLAITPDDIVDYDPVTHTASLFFDGALFSAAENIDALHLQPDGNLLLSTTSIATLGGHTFDSTEIVEYNPTTDTASLFIVPMDAGDDTDALSVFESGALPPAPPAPAMCTGTIIDSFHVNSFAGSDGNLAWDTPWIEKDAGEPVGPDTGFIRIVQDQGNLVLSYEASPGTFERGFDLSAFTSATMTFDYRRVSLDVANEVVTFRVKRIAGPGGTSHLVTGPGTDASYQRVTLDISDVTGSAGEIRISGSNQMDPGDFVLFDNIVICAD